MWIPGHKHGRKAADQIAMEYLEKMDIFLEAMSPGGDPLMEELEQEAVAMGVPIIRRPAQRLLRVLLAQSKPGRILEIGTAVGFSAIWMRRSVSGKCHITTIENYDKRIVLARRNFRRAGVESDIELLEGDAGELLWQISGRFPFIFLDGPKGQYLSYLPRLIDMLEPGGMLVTDNVLQEGRLFDSRFMVERRDRTIHSRMRKYLYELMHCDRLVSTILPVGDGMALCVKATDEEMIS